MYGKELIQDLTKLPEILDQAERKANKGVSEGDKKYFESAYSLLDGCWTNLILAERELNSQYRDLEDEHDDAILGYGVDVDSLGDDSNPALVALALPVYYELLAETEQEIDEMVENVGRDPEDYGSGEILPKES